MLETDLQLAVSTALVPTYGSATQTEFCESYSAVTFQNVDQLQPITDSQMGGAQGTANPHQLPAAITTLVGSMAVNAVMCGNNTTPAISNGGTDTYTINSGYTEGTDIYYANTTVAPTSGVCFETAHKAIAAAGTEQPSCTFAGSVNRWLMIGFTLQRARELDYSVRLLKAGTPVGNNTAEVTAWPVADGYTTYGGPTSLWGQTWSVADINNSNFGVALSARIQNGTARVDHMRITVYSVYSLPIELIDFRAHQEGEAVRLDWATATEHNNDHFVVQRSPDGNAWEDVLQQGGAGNSETTHLYTAIDLHAGEGINYYRLLQVDLDGSVHISPIASVEMHRHGLVVFPNPTTNGDITVYDIALERDQVAVYTEDMRLVRTHVGAGVDPMIHLGDLPDGTYYLMVRDGDQVRTARIMKASSRR